MAGDLVLMRPQNQTDSHMSAGKRKRAQSRPVRQRKSGRGSGLGTGTFSREEELLCHSLREASSYLLSFGDSPAGDDDDFVLLVKCHNFRHTVEGTKRMVNVPRQWDKGRNIKLLGWMMLVPCWPAPRVPP